MARFVRAAAYAAVLVLLATLSVCVWAAPAYADNAECVTCHDTGGAWAGPIATADFTPAAVDRTRCNACHWIGSHPNHYTRSVCSGCHTGWPTRGPLYVSTYVDPRGFGIFWTPASADSDAAKLHAIHNRGSWPAKLSANHPACASCHAPVACDACHADAAAHAPHADAAYAPVTGRVATGAPPGSLDGRGSLLAGTSVRGPDLSAAAAQSCVREECHSVVGRSERYARSDESSASYAGVWNAVADPLSAGGAIRESNRVGDTASYTFTGTGVAWIGRKSLYGGWVQVTLDGEAVATVNTQAQWKTPYPGQRLYEASGLDAGEHTLAIRILPNPTRYREKYTYVSVDAFEVLEGAASSGQMQRPCAGCHADREAVHGYEAAPHTSSEGCIDVCHDGDLKTEHDAQARDCKACHLSADGVVRASITGGDTGCTTCHTGEHASGKSFCYACHAPAQAEWPGQAVAETSRHMGTTTSSRALTTYPASGVAAGECENCHDVHRTTRTAGNDLCFACHDGAGTTRPATYSYQGQGAYAASGHGVDAVDCKACHAVHGATDAGGAVIPSALRVAEPGVCTGTPGQPGCHASGLNAANGTNVLAAFTAGVSASTHHDAYPSGPGKIVCSSCHNPHLDTPTSQFANPQVPGTPLPNATDRFRDATGRVFALVGAQHDGVPPVMNNITTGLVSGSDPTRLWARWYTNEPTNGYVDWGPSISYGNTTNSIYTNYSYHYTSALNFPVGTTWHYRFRSVDAVGNTATSQDYAYRIPYTDLLAGPTVSGGAGGTPVTVTWTTRGACDSWVDYGPTASYGSTAGSATNTTTHSVQLSLPVGIYHLRARSARDIDSYTSSDIVVTVYPSGATAPVLTPVASDSNITGPKNITFSWTQPNTTSAPFTYQLHVWDSTSSPAYDYVSPVLDTTSTALSLDGDHNYSWTVRAWDKNGSPYPLSATSTFSLYYYSGGSGSCPFLYTWNGDEYKFESDEFAAGKLGLNTSKGFRKPNPLDYHVLATEPAIKDGALEYKLVEERAEVDYLDQVKLYTVEAPADREIWVERSQAEGAGRFTTLDAVIHTTERDLRPPVSVTHINTGQDVTAKIAAKDGDYLMLNEDRNNGYDYQTIELDLGDVQDAPMTKLVIDGRTCIPTSVAGRQRSLLFGPQVKFEVQDAAGAWRAVPATNTILPKPPEFERPFVLDLSRIWISESRKVRFTYLYKTYFDAILLDTSADVPVKLTEVPLSSAELQPHGFNRKSSLSELYEYVYGEPESPPYYHLPGNYTKFGGVTPLLDGIDDKFVIFGGGDELTLRFTPPPATPVNTNRRFLFLSDGYYKDLKQTIAHTVDPLPFAAMSNFPYPAGEHYPDDADHQAYLAEWNTRYEDGAASPQETSMLSSLLEGAERLFDSAVRAVMSAFAPEPESAITLASAEDETIYSVDTDRASIDVLYPGTSTAVTPVAGWESASAEASKPTPSAPGTAVAASALTNASTLNNVYWRTDLTTVDRAYNWQVIQFNVPSNLLTGATGLQIRWSGHGEPTYGYPVKTFLWDFQASRWVAASEGWGGTRFDLTHTERQAGRDSFCLTCHTATPPEGASGAASLTSISTIWDSDFHGDGSGTGGGTALKAPYVRSNAAIPCATCHDSHGNSNLNHIKGTVNGTAGIAVSNGVQYQNACRACHEGTVAQYHQQCDYCHYNEHGWGPEINEAWDCTACHQHGKVWVHEDIWCHCDMPSARTF